MIQQILYFGNVGNCIDISETLPDINDARGEQVYAPLEVLDILQSFLHTNGNHNV